MSRVAAHSFLRGRTLAKFGLMLFVVSLLFPIAASLMSAERVPRWMGWLDVTLAGLLVGVLFILEARAPGRMDVQVQRMSYRVYRGLAHLFLGLLVLFFIFGKQIRWEILLPGLAWRMWALVHILPAGLAAWKISSATANKPDTLAESTKND